MSRAGYKYLGSSLDTYTSSDWSWLVMLQRLPMDLNVFNIQLL
jgi:hypothetical protein